MVKEFGRATTADAGEWVRKSDLPHETKRLIGLYVSRIHVTKGFGGCSGEGQDGPLMNVELNYPDLGPHDREGLDEQRRWSQQIIKGLTKFAQSFEPGYFTDTDALIGGPRWVTDPKVGTTCFGSIEMHGWLSPPANLQTGYHQGNNAPVR
ncbi:hypothetical protein [Streptomyces finlayi]|uniref:hypothetical protein n=1 Tax=Streptomyces finlayi TaxID=67296 RepID=UPI00167A367D|nr:hypothetical protein [Streptomyces finlayi]